VPGESSGDPDPDVVPTPVTPDPDRQVVVTSDPEVVPTLINADPQPLPVPIVITADPEPLSGAAQALSAAHAEARHLAEGGDLTGARTLLEDALAIGEVRLGHDHPLLTPLMVDLATLARGLGNLTEALGQLRRAHAIVAATGGPEHPTSLSIEGRLAAVLYRLGDPTEAYDWHLADIGTRVLGSEHPAVKGAQQRLSAAEQAAMGWAPVSDPGPVLLPSVPPSRWWDPDEPSLVPTDAPTPPGVYQRLAPAQSRYQYEPAPEVWQERPSADRGQRGHGGGLALIGGLGAVVLVAAAVVAFQLFGMSSGARNSAPPPTSATSETPDTAVDPSDPTSTPSANRPPAPTDVKLVDNGGSVTLTWADPSGGQVGFIVAGGRDGTPSAPVQSLEPGHTRTTIYGLRTDVNYCYTVAAVWSSATISVSSRTCTHRLSTTRTP
jgi:hypothetical protein